MSPPALVIDTNVIVAGLISAGRESPVTRILDAMLDGRLPFLLSPALLAEYRQVLSRDGLMKLHGLQAEEIDDLLTDLAANAIWREPTTDRAAPDPGDDHLWSLLAVQPHGLLVTGDRLLRDNPPRQGVVISPRDCVERFLSTSP